MSDRCQFLFVPVGGPARVVEGHPKPALMSDLLGGATVTAVILPSARVAAWMRETCATEGSPRNILASVLCMILGGARAIPVLGPCALTLVDWQVMPGDAFASGQPNGWPADAEEKLTVMVQDVERALAGYNAGFSFPELDGPWAAAVRQAADRCMAVPIPDGWPGLVTRESEDPVARLMRRLGLGEAFVSLPVKG